MQSVSEITPNVNGEIRLVAHLDDSDDLINAMIVASIPAGQSVAQATEEPEEPESSHPLDVPPAKHLQLGWIDQYADLMTALTGSPREFNQLAGIITVAAAIQRKARLRMSFADIYSNIYACIIAPSSVYHKSSAIHKPRIIFQRALLEKTLLSELMTSEGLLKQMQSQPSGVILRDEIGTLFNSHNTRYLQQLKPDLTALYDCYPYSRSLSQGDVKVEKPYLNILGATTPTRFFEGVSFTDWSDGFLARWLFVTPEKEPDFDAMTGLYSQQHDDQINKLAFKLMEFESKKETDFILAGNAFDLWDKWQRQAAKDAYYYGDDVTAAIVTRYAAYALKFSLILAAVNDSWGTITPEIMQTAIHLADNYKRNVHRLLGEKQNFGVSGAKLQKVFRVICIIAKESGKATTKQIMQKTGFKKAALTPVLEKLIEIGAVMSEESGNGHKFVNTCDALPIKSW